MEQGTASAPVRRNVEGTDIRTYRVYAVVRATVVEAGASLYERRCVAVRVFDIAINGGVVTEHFPIGRDRDGIPCGVIEPGVHEIERTLCRVANQTEAPRAIEVDAAVRCRIDPRSIPKCGVGKHLAFVGVRHV